MTNLSQKSRVVYSAWKLTHSVSWGCDCKDTEDGLEQRQKWIIAWSTCCSYIFIAAKEAIEAISGRILDKW